MKDKFLPALVSVIVTSIALATLAYLSSNIFEVYSQGMFIVTPIIGGIISVLIYNRAGKKRLSESLIVSIISGCIALCGFIVVGLEGFICLLMAVPIALPLFLVGGLIGYAISRTITRKHVSDVASLLICMFGPLFMGFESIQEPQIHERQSVTKVIISGDINDVWHEVIQFSPIPEPTELLFRMGIAYPTHAKIEGTGVGAIRYCNFSTGAFVEPITHWDKNKKLAFDVTEQPIPMTELSPYSDIHPPHLDWAVISHKGEFLLNDLGNGKIELTGTTWYHTVMKPEVYWGTIADEMIHMIHKRVLDHIKSTVESKANKSVELTATAAAHL